MGLPWAWRGQGLVGRRGLTSTLERRAWVQCLLRQGRARLRAGAARGFQGLVRRRGLTSALERQAWVQCLLRQGRARLWAGRGQGLVGRRGLTSALERQAWVQYLLRQGRARLRAGAASGDRCWGAGMRIGAAIPLADWAGGRSGVGDYWATLSLHWAGNGQGLVGRRGLTSTLERQAWVQYLLRQGLARLRAGAASGDRCRRAGMRMGAAIPLADWTGGCSGVGDCWATLSLHWAGNGQGLVGRRGLTCQPGATGAGGQK